MSTPLTCQRLAAFYTSSSPFLSPNLSRPVNALYFQHSRTYANSTGHLPRLIQPSIWNQVIPKALRNRGTWRASGGPQGKKGWNPATFYIWIFLLIGSNAIQMIALKNEFLTFSRRADAKIRLLKDVLDRVQRGEDVDVEKALGTRNEDQEQVWRDVLRDFEEEGRMWRVKDRKSEDESQPKEEARLNGAENATEPGASSGTDPESSMSTSTSASTANANKSPPRFY